jgi:beta-glucanase (GH16 family)
VKHILSGLILCLFGGLAARAASPPQDLRPDDLGAASFSETFQRLDAGPDRTANDAALHRWRTILQPPRPGNADSRSLSANTWFGDDTDGQGPSPFALTSKGLTITAVRQPQPYGRSWRSGVLTTKFSFSQYYGYFEFTADLPTCVKGAWPSLWLLPELGVWPAGGEIDFPETIGDGKIYWTAISGASGRKTQQQLSTPGECARAFHHYGVLWRSDVVAFYYDRKLIGTTPTPRDYKSAMFFLVDLNVGGGWPGQPDPALNKVAMTVRQIEAWPLHGRLAP